MGGSGSKTVLNELHGLQERLIDGLAAPELADRRAENARLRALLGDAVRVIGQLRGVDGDDAAAGDAEAKEAAAAAPRPFGAAELDDAVAVRSRAAVDDLAPVDADAVIRRGVPWSDPDFPAANVPSLGDAATVAAKRWGDVAWVRARALAPRGRIFAQNPSPYDVAQGGLGDCYLLSALCVLAERPGRVHRLFRTTEVNAAGIYGARLYLRGEKRLVLVDDALPARDGRPLFAASRTDGELWVSLYEKAFAKVYGSFAAIEAGSTAAALETLAGAPSTRTRLRAGVADAAAAADRLWELASAAASRGHVAALSVGDHPRDLQKLAGIVEERAYAVLGAREERGGARLLKLRNPMANGVEWRGAWSDGSDEWSDDLRRTLGRDVAAAGVFHHERRGRRERLRRGRRLRRRRPRAVLPLAAAGLRGRRRARGGAQGPAEPVGRLRRVDPPARRPRGRGPRGLAPRRALPRDPPRGRRGHARAPRHVRRRVRGGARLPRGVGPTPKVAVEPRRRRGAGGGASAGRSGRAASRATRPGTGPTQAPAPLGGAAGPGAQKAGTRKPQTKRSARRNRLGIKAT